MGCTPSRETPHVLSNGIEPIAKKNPLEPQEKRRRVITANTQSCDPSCCGITIQTHKSASISGKSDSSGDVTSTMFHYEGIQGKRIEHVYDGVFDNRRDLGKSMAGVVRHITHRATKVDYAVKIFRRRFLTEKGARQLKEEIQILSEVDHPNIIRLQSVYESERAIYIVQELCEGGDLFEWLTNPGEHRKDPYRWEKRCADIIKQLLSGLVYLHSKGIVHRDLKLENILFESKSANSKLKIIDFGLSKHFQPGERHTEYVGSLYTMAPEVLWRNYNERCDLWSIGVITYLLLGGEAPFGGCYGEKDHRPIIARITHGHYHFEPDNVWDKVSYDAKLFIRRLLMVNPDYRPTAKETQTLPWLLNQEEDDDDVSWRNPLLDIMQDLPERQMLATT